MRIWIVRISEPVPIGSGQPRLMRGGLLADAAIARGHEVVWWSSDFCHYTKEHYFRRTSAATTRNGVRVVLMNGGGYRRHVSVSRLMDHLRMTRIFSRLAIRQRLPDLIICAYPDLFLADAVVRFARRYSIPIIVDARDQWPDHFLNLVPNVLRGVTQALLRPLFRRSRLVFRGASALSGITDTFLEWALRRAGRPRGCSDRVFPLAYPDENSTQKDPARAVAHAAWLARHGIDGQRPLVVFFGTIGRHVDLQTVIRAASEPSCRAMRFVLCGDGPQMDDVRAWVKRWQCDHVVVPGWVDKTTISGLMAQAVVALAPYQKSPDFEASIPNKVIEYLSAGLPVVTPLGGETGAMLRSADCGVVYPAGDHVMLARRLAALVEDPEGARRMGVRGRKKFTESYRAESVYADFIAHGEDLVAHHVRRARLPSGGTGEVMWQC